MSDLFVVVAPRCTHSVTKARCGFGTWSQRGWCRLELWCKMMSAHTRTPAVVISDVDKTQFLVPLWWTDQPPHEGNFTHESDRAPVVQVMKDLLLTKIQSLKSSQNLDVYRYYVARFDTLLGQTPRQRTLEGFLQDFEFKSLDCAKNSRGISAIACATLAGDANMISLLCDAGMDVNRRSCAIPEVYIHEKVAPVMLAAALGWRQDDVITTLVERKADMKAATASGHPLLGWCKSAKTVDFLIWHRADVNQQSGLAGFPPLTVACFLAAPTPVIRTLLKHGAAANPRPGRVGCIHPLASVAYRATMSTNSLEVAAMLLDARADVNIQYHSSGILRAAELISRAARACGQSSPGMQIVSESGVQHRWGLLASSAALSWWKCCWKHERTLTFPTSARILPCTWLDPGRSRISSITTRTPFPFDGPVLCLLPLRRRGRIIHSSVRA
ncbi:unnamed protein product [Effrenium voratum]|nr:unnamed protein product [Effrenium voratum]